MIAIIDYGMGNLRSVQKALESVGAKTTITQNKKDIESASKVVLPGVGAMQPAIDKLNELQLVDAISTVIKSGKPFLGICLGLQLLFEQSDEGGNVKGLGIVPGQVKKFESNAGAQNLVPLLKVPQMGWNQLHVTQPNCPLFRNIAEKSFVYFCHSYFVKPVDANVTATTTDYGMNYTSSICKDNLFGVQFHPEKSQTIGLNILKNFVEVKS